MKVRQEDDQGSIHELLRQKQLMENALVTLRNSLEKAHEDVQVI
jgi:hypothetical protein